MHILFKRHGQKRLFKRYESVEALNEEIKLGHNEKFPGNNQFHYDVITNEINILNNRLNELDCREQLDVSGCLQRAR
ncbi:hypothetical protein [Desertivirga brevis]|uniref:hypothetical protein n=1 Tax=Desertivirga brevis TaxID=2810310 RepID=UPI001A96DD35|nr:hypothetical protein [Pedobacter sp. SYSU D00873]